MKYRPDALMNSNAGYCVMTERMATDRLGLDKFDRYRRPTEPEVNLLYCDLHSQLVLKGLEKEEY